MFLRTTIPWPQYHEDGPKEGSLSDTWGVYMIPTVFIVDTNGKVASIQAPHGQLDNLIPAMLNSIGNGIRN